VVLEFGAADVLLNAGEKNAVLGSPLFLCPAAQSSAVGVGVNALAKAVATAHREGALPDANLGRQAIAHVIDCRPTLYKKVLDTCNLLNWYHADKQQPVTPIVGSDIVVCAFRIRDYTKLCNLLGLTDAQVSKAAKVPTALVSSLTANYRLHLAPVLKVYDVLREAALAKPRVEGEAAELERLRSKGIRDNIVADRKPFINIQKIDGDDSGTDIYVLNEHNVVSAPTNGHPWELGLDL